jgi:hypothetical protein
MDGLAAGPLTVRWTDVVGVGVRADGAHEVLTDEGTLVPLRARDWRGEDAVIETLRARVPRRLFLDAPAEGS